MTASACASRPRSTTGDPPPREVLVPVSLPLLLQPETGSRLVDLAGLTMGTHWRVTLVLAGSPHSTDAQLAALRAAIEQELARVIEQMSPWVADSALSRFNAAPAGSRLPLPPELFEVLQLADALARDCDGACDVTVGELVDLWGFGPPIHWQAPDFVPPTPAVVAAALARSGWSRLALDPVTRSALQPGGLRLDLSAIAKGFAVDQIARRLTREGQTNHLVDVGGELRGSGIKPDGQPWWVGIETALPVASPPAAASATTGSGPPLAPAGATGATASANTVIALCGLAVATSGDFRRCYAIDGQRHAHTIDPRSGAPLRNDVAAVTVVAREAVLADALSTVLMVLGPEAGAAWAEARSIAARFLQRQVNPASFDAAPTTDGGYRTTRTSAWLAMLN